MLVRSIWHNGVTIQQRVELDVKERSCTHTVFFEIDKNGKKSAKGYGFDADDFQKACEKYEELEEKYITKTIRKKEQK